jgi:hypothetical protein
MSSAKMWIALTVLAFTGHLLAADDRGIGVREGEHRVALVIGNGAYPAGPLRNPPNDARAVAAALREVGFEVRELENGSQAEMKRAIQRFGHSLKRDSVGVFYYAGHGIQARGKNWLVPVDAAIETEGDLELWAIDLDGVLAQLEDADNRLNVIVLDACRNNPFARGFRSASRGLASVNAPGGTLIAYATAPGSVASDGDESNGLYTQELLRQIRTPGLTVEEVFKRVRIHVRERSGGKQIPWESSSLMGDFYFADGRTPAKPGTLPQPADSALSETVSHARITSFTPPPKSNAAVPSAGTSNASPTAENQPSLGRAGLTLQETDARTKFSNEQFGFGSVPGSQADRGKALIAFGAPERIQHAGNEQTWTYSNGDPTLTFTDPLSNGEWRAVTESRTRINTALGRMSIADAIDRARRGIALQGASAYLYHAELVSPSGEYYVPLQLFLPNAAGTPAADTFFCVVEDASGRTVKSIQEPIQPLERSNRDLFIDRTFILASGNYTAIAGVSRNGQPLAVASRVLDLHEVRPTDTGVSSLILSGDIHELAEATPEKSPFAFGKLKIVPRANLVFGSTEELFYFVELRNPGLDPKTNRPDVTVSVDLTGGPKGNRLSRPDGAASLLPLAGKEGRGQFSIIDSIPLGEIKPRLDPGSYTLKLRIVDRVLSRTYDVQQAFTIGS